jgi:hypothetical protein
MPEGSSEIFYTDVNGDIISVPVLNYGQSITICALEDSIVSTNMPSDYTISAPGVLCQTINEVIEDPNACGEQNCTTDLDCDQLRLHPLVKQACITIEKSKGSGQLPNGSYQAVIAYSENGIKLTDYSMPSNAQSLWDHTGIGGSIDIVLDNLDQNFEEFELVIISTTNQQTIAKKIGYYSINQTRIHLDTYQQSLPTVDLQIIPLKTVVYEKSEKMFDVGGYLVRTSVTTQPFFNYQPLANQIRANWVAVEYLASYYWDGGNNVGNMRDEVYAYFIRWVYKTGARSASFHIPGRASQTSDRALVLTGDDVLDTSKRERWQVYDTATSYSSSGVTPDGGIIVARGNMAFWESTEKYPNTHPDVWGDLCNEPIRHHKMPSNETTHIHNNTGDRIYVLGVEFDNIQPPVDENGDVITDIVGYEILRGSREGNRSILAKGLFCNMLEYELDGGGTVKGLIQNYPYNDIDTDPFLNSNNNIVVKKDLYSFHAPENNLIKPYVGSGGSVKIYTEEIGDVKIQGELPHKHPMFKFMSEEAFQACAVLAGGMALLNLFGKSNTGSSTTSHTQLEVITVPWAVTNPGAGAGGVGTHLKDPITNFDSQTFASRESGTASVFSDLFINQVSAITGSIGTSGVTGSVISTVLGVLMATFTATLTFYQAFDECLEIIYKIIKFREHVIQLNSHGFYNDFDSVTNANVPVGLGTSFSRNIKKNGVKYVSSGIQDFDSVYRINNSDRNKYLAVQLETNLPDRINIDDSKSLLDDTNKPFKIFTKKTSAYYGAIKFDYENQYGQLYGITQLPTSSCVFPIYGPVLKTPTIFGGDVYINRYTEKNPYYFFNTWLFDVPNGTDFNYLNYVNGPIPKYWLDSRRYDASTFSVAFNWSFSISNAFLPELDFTSPQDFYNLHGYNNTSPLSFGFKNAWMYLFNNGVRDFFTESELNMAFRDYGEEPYQKFYDPVGNSFTDLTTMFRSDLIKNPIYYEYDLSLSASKLYSNFKSWSNILPRDYDPKIYSSCFEYYPKRVVYSLQQQSGLKRDNWRNYLQFNYRDWNGKVNSIKSLNAQGALILFEDHEPIQFAGIDTLQSTAGVKYSLGDGGLFMQNMQSIVNADDAFEYGTSISNRGVVNTPYGLFWISQKTGKICSYNGGNGIEEISHDGIKHWFIENLPSPLLEVYPEFPLYDNMVEGISCHAIFDAQYELLYFTKRDFKPTPAFMEILPCLQYVEGEGFYVNQSQCSGADLIPTCPQGYFYNSLTNKCEKTTVTNVCPEGYTYDSELNICTKETIELADCGPAECASLVSFKYSTDQDTRVTFEFIPCGIEEVQNITLSLSPGTNVIFDVTTSIFGNVCFVAGSLIKTSGIEVTDYVFDDSCTAINEGPLYLITETGQSNSTLDFCNLTLDTDCYIIRQDTDPIVISTGDRVINKNTLLPFNGNNLYYRVRLKVLNLSDVSYYVIVDYNGYINVINSCSDVPV